MEWIFIILEIALIVFLVIRVADMGRPDPR
jgi:hypothetical protein